MGPRGRLAKREQARALGRKNDGKSGQNLKSEIGDNNFIDGEKFDHINWCRFVENRTVGQYNWNISNLAYSRPEASSEHYKWGFSSEKFPSNSSERNLGTACGRTRARSQPP